jgi:hypothetical protein
MKNKKSFKEIYPIIVMVVALILGIYLFLKEAREIAYPPYASIEYYKFNINKLELVAEIEKFKELHPELNPPNDDPIFGNSIFNPNDYMAPMFFYYPEKQKVLYTVVVESSKNNQSKLGFYRIIDLKDRYKNVEEINYTLGCSDNRKQLKLFEERIVNPLHKQIREKYKRLKQKK